MDFCGLKFMIILNSDVLLRGQNAKISDFNPLFLSKSKLVTIHLKSMKKKFPFRCKFLHHSNEHCGTQ